MKEQECLGFTQPCFAYYVIAAKHYSVPTFPRFILPTRACFRVSLRFRFDGKNNTLVMSSDQTEIGQLIHAMKQQSFHFYLCLTFHPVSEDVDLASESFSACVSDGFPHNLFPECIVQEILSWLKLEPVMSNVHMLRRVCGGESGLTGTCSSPSTCDARCVVWQSRSFLFQIHFSYFAPGCPA